VGDSKFGLRTRGVGKFRQFRNAKWGIAVSFGRGALERRTREFAVQAVRFVARSPRGLIGDALGRQLLRSATSIGAKLHKIGVVEKEAAETQY